MSGDLPVFLDGIDAALLKAQAEAAGMTPDEYVSHLVESALNSHAKTLFEDEGVPNSPAKGPRKH